jgi:interferon-induced transmembrane protein/uncharacterized protein DUF4339
MWYFTKDGTQHGPLLEGDLRRMALDGSLQPEDLVWTEGMASWLPASEVGVFEFPALPPAPPAPPPVPPHYVAPPPPQAPAPSQYGGPPPSYQPAPPTFGAAGADIPNYLPWAIAATLFCCMPGGIVSIVFAVKANTAKTTGDLAAARSAANQAKIWLIVSVVGGLLASVFVILASIAGNM